MQVGLSPRHGSGGGDGGTYDLFGHIVEAIYAFVDSNFGSREITWDAVNQEEVALADLFEKRATRWFVKEDHLPGMLELKAFAFDKTRLYLETSPIDRVAMAEGLASNELPLSLSDGCRTIRHAKYSSLDVSVSEQSRPEVKHDDEKIVLGSRVLLSARFPTRGQDRDEMARLFDLFVEKNEFLAPEELEVATAQAVAKPALGVTLDLQLRMAVEQRPVLALSHRVEGRLTLEQNLSMLLMTSRSLRTMSSEEGVRNLRAVAELRGPQAVANTLVFALAGRVKEANPSLTWPAARALARRRLIRIATSGQ